MIDFRNASAFRTMLDNLRRSPLASASATPPRYRLPNTSICAL